jgi:hypothetical protein
VKKGAKEERSARLQVYRDEEDAYETWLASAVGECGRRWSASAGEKGKKETRQRTLGGELNEAGADGSGVAGLLEGSGGELLDDLGVEVALEVLEGKGVVEDLNVGRGTVGTLDDLGHAGLGGSEGRGGGEEASDGDEGGGELHVVEKGGVGCWLNECGRVGRET